VGVPMKPLQPMGNTHAVYVRGHRPRPVALTYPLLAPLPGWGVSGGFEPIQALPGVG
jgi:hypothetical protein